MMKELVIVAILVAVAAAQSCSDLGAECACVLVDSGCGICADADGKTVGGCLDINSTCDGDLTFRSDVYETEQECKNAQLGATIGGIVGPVVGFFLFMVWFCLRGKFWWRSTSHKRGCCAEDSCCAKSCCGPMCGCKPWDAQPPPHSEYWCSAGWPCKEDGRKASAYRVAPCFPHNPVAWCTNIDDYDDEAHPCGLGCGCMCNWLPGCCCLLPPKPLLILLCEDVVIESEVDEGACDCSCCPCGGCTCCPCCSDEAGKKSKK